MLVIHNAIIHTPNSKNQPASALAIHDGRIVAMGREEEVLQSFPTAPKVNVGGRSIIPGLTDSHIHLEEYALGLRKINCETRTLQDCLERVAERVKSSDPGEWILGHGWNQNNWDEGYGSASQLDRISPRNPVYLTHKSLHCGWANTAALQLAGISASTPDPDGGRLSRTPSGEPDGILFESAVGMIEQVIPAASIEQSADAINAAIPLLWRMGLTGVHDFDGPRCFSALQLLHSQGKLKLRVLKSIHQEDMPHIVQIGLRAGFGDDLLRIGPLKLFSDGALGPHTASMLDPYEDDPGNFGIAMMGAEMVFELGRTAIQNGISLAVHAIGDRANCEVLDGYAKLREFERSLPRAYRALLRHRIEHVQVINPMDLTRFAQLDIIASMQPIHATSDMLMADRYWGKRSEYSYAWHSLLTSHARLIFGSDAPVESPNPFWGLHAAVTRRRADGSPSPGGWYPEQRLDVSQAISAYTSSPAFATGMENSLGTIKPGFLADLLVLNENPYTCPQEQLLMLHPVAAMIGGEWVFNDLD